MDVSEKIVRNSIGLIDYDYSQPGAYFVTICTGNRACFFGNIIDGIMISFSICEIVQEIWLEIPEKFQDIKLDAFVTMPNHVHGIIIIDKEGKGLIHQSQKNDCRNSHSDLIHQIHVKNLSNRQKVGLMNQAPAIDQGSTNAPSDRSYFSSLYWKYCNKPNLEAFPNP